MIQTFLSNKLQESRTRKAMEVLFRKIASEAWDRGGTIVAGYGDPPRSQKVLNSEASYLEFLMAKDFYLYRFPIAEGFWFDLRDVSGNCNLSTLLSPEIPDGAALVFRTKYPPAQYSGEYDILRQHLKNGETTLSKFRKKVGRGSDYFPLSAVEEAFDYEKLSKEDRAAILDLMDVPVCPYCNMSYLLRYDKDGKPRNTADIDHFYIKSVHPEYSLCLYNMIPSCPVCNSRMKLDREMGLHTHIYPHREGFGDAAQFRAVNIPDYMIHRDPHARVALELTDQGPEDLRCRIQNSAELFHLEELYSDAHHQAEELMANAEIYNEGYSQELEDQFRAVFQGRSIRDMVFGPGETEEQYARRSLGKLRMDLLKQMGIYK